MPLREISGVGVDRFLLWGLVLTGRASLSPFGQSLSPFGQSLSPFGQTPIEKREPVSIVGREPSEAWFFVSFLRAFLQLFPSLFRSDRFPGSSGLKPLPSLLG